MQFEAKALSTATGQIVPASCSTGCVPVSSPVGTPWRSINQPDAYAACENAGYAMISNREWMTIARSAETNTANWTSGIIGTGKVVEGNTCGSYAEADINDPYAGTGETAATVPECRRTLTLGDGQVIWDFPGNAQEWIDWTLGAPLDPPPNCATADLDAFACNGVVDDDFNAITGSYDRTYGVVIIIGGTGGAARRGGQAGDHDLQYAGIYAMNVNRDPTFTNTSTGFRCVKRF